MRQAGAALAGLVAFALAACSTTTPASRPRSLPPVTRPIASPRAATYLPASVPQGALVIGRTEPGTRVEYGGRTLVADAGGRFVFGVGRDAVGPLVLRFVLPDGRSRSQNIAVTPREWPLERVDGAPPETVEPPPAIADRIAREQARVAAARLRDDDRVDYARAFAWPVEGRVSGRFGSQRVYALPDGTVVPRSPHSGMDIAAPPGTPVRAPAPGVVTFADADLYLTGGTVLVDHGHGVSSSFLHLSRIDVRVGDRVEQGEVIGAVGATGRASGPHLHWGVSWFDVRIDPLLVLTREP